MFNIFIGILVFVFILLILIEYVSYLFGEDRMFFYVRKCELISVVFFEGFVLIRIRWMWSDSDKRVVELVILFSFFCSFNKKFVKKVSVSD